MAGKFLAGKVQVAKREHLQRACESIIDGGPRRIDSDAIEAFKSAALGYAHTQYGDPMRVLEALYESETETGHLVRKAVEVIDEAGGDNDDGDIEKQADHHASTVADLLVEAGSFPHRAAALQHLLHKPTGQALLQRMHKTEKELPMDKIEPLRDVVKQRGIVAVAKSIVDENRSYGITEHEFVELATEYAKAQHPELSGSQAFAKLYQIPEIWRACNVLKSMPFQVDVEPLFVGGADTRDLSDTSKAIEQLKQLGRDKWPTASEADQFERALCDPVNHKLARRAVPIPQATTSYPFPR
jgi:hypothetical protein